MHSTSKAPPASGPGVNGYHCHPIRLIAIVTHLEMSSNASTSTAKPEASTTELRPYKVYKPSSVTSSSSPLSLPDNYFDPTAADLQAAQQTLTNRVQALTNAPLELRAVREGREQAKRDRWPNTTIRVRFPDRTQLEGTFPSTSKIRFVYAFVRNALRDDVKPIKFILYQSPPKRDLKVSDPKVRDLTLTELQLAPSSVLLLRFEDSALNGSDTLAPLLPSILSQAVDLPIPPNFDSPSASSGSSKIPAEPRTSSNSGEKKIPKWLKLGLKK